MNSSQKEWVDLLKSYFKKRNKRVRPPVRDLKYKADVDRSISNK